MKIPVWKVLIFTILIAIFFCAGLKSHKEKAKIAESSAPYAAEQKDVVCSTVNIGGICNICVGNIDNPFCMPIVALPASKANHKFYYEHVINSSSDTEQCKLNCQLEMPETIIPVSHL